MGEIRDCLELWKFAILGIVSLQICDSGKCKSENFRFRKSKESKARSVGIIQDRSNYRGGTRPWPGEKMHYNLAGFSPGMSERTFSISSSSAGRTRIFQTDRMKRLFLDVLRHYRRERKYLLHAFVMMPDHIHLLITPPPALPLEKCIQLIKGNFSYRAKKEFGIRSEIWTPGFNLHRVKDPADYDAQVTYIHMNPVKIGLVSSPELYECSSAWPGRKMDPNPFVARAKAQSS